ncbi:MAG TPA: NifU family protein [bacterium]|nr:NifU family protein [bacterium]
MREKVEKVIQEIRAILRADGSDIELINVSPEGIVQIRFVGVCGTCGGSMNTLKQGVERMLKEQVPEVRGVEAV